MNEKNVSENLKNFYGDNFEQYGATPFGVSWRDQDSMNLRYDRMLNVIDKTHITQYTPTILDVGCGYGGLLEYINNHTKLKINYKGIDIVPASIDYAKKNMEMIYLIY